jgi:hypothetical protein
MNLKTKSVCVVDFGLFLELAVTLAQSFGQVFYHFKYDSPFPTSNHSLVGQGLKGVTVARSLSDIIPETDLFCFPDTYLGDLQDDLLAEGKLVWGSRWADELELRRAEGKSFFESLGLPVGPYEVIKGMAALRTYLKEHKDQYVKCSYYRGDFETFQAPDYKFIETKLDALEVQLGIKKYWQEFVVEAAIPEAVETGYDGYCVDGQWPDAALCGIEVKGRGYLGRLKQFKDIPKPLKDYNDKLGPVLKQYQYRNFLSSEIRVNKKQVGYVLDPCMRCGNPPAATMLNFFDNLGEIVWEGAQGKLVQPQSRAAWAAQIQMHSEWLDIAQLNLQFPEKIRKNIKLINGMKHRGEYYIIPQQKDNTNVGAVVATGQSAGEAIAKCQAYAGQVRAYGLDCDPHCLDEAEAEWAKLKDFGVEL